MKKIIVALLFIIIIQNSYSQEIYTFAEKAKNEKLIFLLKSYHTNKPGEKILINERVEKRKINALLTDFLVKNDIVSEKNFEKLFIYCDFYAQANGKIDYCIFKVTDENKPNLEKEKRLKNVLQKFCNENVLPVNFQEKSAINYANNFEEKGKIELKHNELVQLEGAETILPDTVYKISLTRLKIDKIPILLKRFFNVRELDLSENFIQELPAWISEMKDLKYINLSKNDLVDNKIKFTKNNHIKTINFQFNSLKKIPKSVKKNRELDILLLGNNPIKVLNNKAFSGLSKLTILNLYNLSLTKIPKGIKKIQNIKELDLYYNNITNLPKNIKKLTSLETLAISYNNLNGLPKKLYYLQNLKTIYAHHNRLFDLPKLPASITYLDIGHNYFATIPATILSLNSLKELDISFNQLNNLPIEMREIKSLKTLFWEKNKFLEKTDSVDILLKELQKNEIEIH